MFISGHYFLLTLNLCFFGSNLTKISFNNLSSIALNFPINWPRTANNWIYFSGCAALIFPSLDNASFVNLVLTIASIWFICCCNCSSSSCWPCNCFFRFFSPNFLNFNLLNFFKFRLGFLFFFFFFLFFFFWLYTRDLISDIIQKFLSFFCYNSSFVFPFFYILYQSFFF